MELKELKHNIEHNTLDTNLVIMKYSGNGDFIIHQYLNKYITDNNLELTSIDNLTEIELSTNSLFNTTSNILYYYEVDILETIPVVSNTNKLWIKCKKLSKSIDKSLVVEIPKLEKWQIIDYISTVCNGLSEDRVEELYKIYTDNIFRISMEISKITLFDEDKNKCYDRIKNQLYADSTDYTIFDIVNCITHHDKSKLTMVYSNINNIDVDIFGLLSLLMSNFKNIISIQLSKTSTPESLNISSKQFWAIKKYSCGYYNKEQLVKIYSFLCTIDYKIKSGSLDTRIALDYVICKIMSI